MLGVQELDAKMNGPIIVARNLESIRGIVDGVREELNLAALHPDSKIHLSICRLTGKNADGDRDDQLLRDRVQPHWPLLENGFPDVLSALPMLPRQRLEHAQASAGSSTDCAEQPAISEISSHWDVRRQAVSRGVSANRKIMNAPISRADVSQVEEASASWMFVGGKHVPTTSRVSAQGHSQMQEKMMCRRKRLQDEMTNECAEQCSSRCEPVCPALAVAEGCSADDAQEMIQNNFDERAAELEQEALEAKAEWHQMLEQREQRGPPATLELREPSEPELAALKHAKSKKRARPQSKIGRAHV